MAHLYLYSSFFDNDCVKKPAENSAAQKTLTSMVAPMVFRLCEETDVTP